MTNSSRTAATPPVLEPSELIVLRKLLVEGTESIARTDPVALRMGVLLVDLAGEAMAKMALRHLGASLKDDKSLLHGLVAKLEDRGHGYARDILPLRAIRNPLMHDGTIPDVAEARRLAERSRGAILRLAREILNCDLLNLRLVDFISDERIRMLLADAESRFTAQKFDEVAAVTSATFAHAMARWTDQLKALFEIPRDADPQVTHMATALSAGIYLPDLARFREITRGAHANVSVSGAISISFWRSPWVKQEQARFALDFAGGVALQIESRLRS